MTNQPHPQLSKSRFLAGLQCLKRLYLECYHRELADPIDPARRRIFDTGHAIGELARQRFPGGRLIDEPYYEHTHAVETTKTLLASDSVPPLYEAAFTFERIRIRVDILNRNDESGFDLIEVKSSTRLRPEHVADVAIQLYVVEGSGVPVRSAYVMHLNRTRPRHRERDDLERMFSIEDVTEKARSLVSDHVPHDLTRMWDSLKQDTEPDIGIGDHCERPYRCPFFGHCHTKNVIREDSAKLNRPPLP